ncbi:E3 ubiquitin-protein ligase RNF216 [Anabrus simplex]|uniref:E3 ubiquitin-protein ligase RNF216 n=1 Tax=Anabrus simplex TaxID=316456 RepID=UPI0035A2C355
MAYWVPPTQNSPGSTSNAVPVTGANLSPRSQRLNRGERRLLQPGASVSAFCMQSLSPHSSGGFLQPERQERTKNEDVEHQYMKLLDMFPNADTLFLWRECKLRAGNKQAMDSFIAELRENNCNNNTLQAKIDDPVQIQHLKLLEIFPDADPDYLWDQCSQRINDENSLQEFINDALTHHSYPKYKENNNMPSQRGGNNSSHVEFENHPDNSKPKDIIDGVEDCLQEIVTFQYHYMLEMLPNADPLYLLEKCKSFAGNEEKLQEFLSEALEKQDFPTVEDHIEKQKANMLQKKYLEDFFAEDFMNVFPDPWHYFLVEKPGSKEACPFAKEYLMRRYTDVSPQIIDNAYKKNNHSLARTCKELDRSHPVPSGNRKNILYGLTDLTVPFVQEVAFIENEAKIKDYIEFRKMIREKAFARAKAAGTLLECACCFNNELLPEDVTTCSSGHLFCVECVTRGAEAWIGEGRTRFPCYVECTGEFSLTTLQCVLKPTVFSSLLLRKQLIEVTEAGISDIETCPFCDFVTIPPEGAKVFNCLNPLCMKDSCRACKEPNHIPLRCNEVEKPEEIRMRQYIEDKMTQALVRECWKCKRKFIKQDGCNKMTCTCGARMCYLCRQPVDDYSHFHRGACPLYSKNEELHVKAVMKEGIKAKETVLSANPGFKLKNDPTVIPPK